MRLSLLRVCWPCGVIVQSKGRAKCWAEKRGAEPGSWHRPRGTLSRSCQVLHPHSTTCFPRRCKNPADTPRMSRLLDCTRLAPRRNPRDRLQLATANWSFHQKPKRTFLGSKCFEEEFLKNCCLCTCHHSDNFDS